MSENTKLTVSDPVDAETMHLLESLSNQRASISMKILELEEEKVRLVVMARKAQEKIDQLFAKILAERGMPKDHPLVVNREGVIQQAEQP